MSIRTQQIASSLRGALQESISRGLSDPRVRGLITITRIEVPPDLSEAQVYVSVLPAEQGELTLHGLRSAAGHLRAEARKRIRLRTMPRLSFRLDESLKKQAEIDRAIREAVGEERIEAIEGVADEGQTREERD